MDAAEFRQRGREMVDYIANYLENIRERNVVHSVSPGYLRDLLPEEAPRDPENFDDVFKDIERVIMPGVCMNNFVLNICLT
jgi:aromatic-L-amino-acid decarboxylase